MSEPEKSTGLDSLEFVTLEKELALAEKRIDIEDRLRRYGIIDLAVERATELTVSLSLSIPPAEICTAGVYRIANRAGKDLRGGVQIGAHLLGDDGFMPFDVRVPVYQIGAEGHVRPVGGIFDDIDMAAMVAIQGDELWALSQELGVELDPDLTRMIGEPAAQHMTMMAPPSVI